LPVQAQPLTDSRHIGLQQLQGKALGPEFRACRLIGNGGVHVLQAELKTLPQPGRSGSKYRRQTKTGENPDKKCRFFETQIRFKNLKSRRFQ